MVMLRVLTTFGNWNEDKSKVEMSFQTRMPIHNREPTLMHYDGYSQPIHQWSQDLQLPEESADVLECELQNICKWCKPGIRRQWSWGFWQSLGVYSCWWRLCRQCWLHLCWRQGFLLLWWCTIFCAVFILFPWPTECNCTSRSLLQSKSSPGSCLLFRFLRLLL